MTENALAMTERHIREAEAHIARQHEIIAEMDRDGHDEVAGKAREFLVLLEENLLMAREHHARELQKQQG